MIYLATELWPYLAVAFVLGLITGWYSWKKQDFD